MVSANLPAFSTQGTRIDVNVSALGDAKSLLGGVLLVTPLMGADGEVYAVAQGPVAVSGFSAQGAAASITKGVPTNGRISNGAIVEREIPFDLARMQTLRLALRNPDLTTAQRIAQAINTRMQAPIAAASDPATVHLTVPQNYPGNMVSLLSQVEQLPVEPDQAARVVIDESSGVIVMGADVRVSTVAIAQGNLTIRVSETPQVSQPQPFSQNGQTVVVPRTQVQVDEDTGRRLAVVQEGISLQNLVDGLNALGIGPRDMISILQAIKAAGALQAEIEVI
jgi:flagellar P-ring protein precursor FlgI